MAVSGQNPIIQSDENIHEEEQRLDSAMTNSGIYTTFDDNRVSKWSEARKVDLFTYIRDGLYRLKDPIINPEHGSVYSVDMVRFDFYNDSQQDVIDAIEKSALYNVLNSYTSNRYGTYRFMWTVSYADGEYGGSPADPDNGLASDGDRSVVIKLGYGVVSKEGLKRKGFVEFNPNKCYEMAEKIVRLLQGVGCDFVLKRWDLAIDYGVERYPLRMIRDKRKYEFHQSNGITEYLGRRNAPGRVKVYDKAAEQKLDGKSITRVELTCDAAWNEAQIMEKLPCVFKPKRAISEQRKWSMSFGMAIMDMLGYINELRSDDGGWLFVPEHYIGLCRPTQATALRKVIRCESERLQYDLVCIGLLVKRVNSMFEMRREYIEYFDVKSIAQMEWLYRREMYSLDWSKLLPVPKSVQTRDLFH